MPRRRLLTLLPALSTMPHPVQGQARRQHPLVLAVIIAIIVIHCLSTSFPCIPTERMPAMTTQGNMMPQICLVVTFIASSHHCRCEPPPPITGIIAANLHQFRQLRCIADWPSHHFCHSGHLALLCFPPHCRDPCRGQCPNVAVVTASKQRSSS
jgi:hypothetical protein